jgi:putative pyruvate formate lyase activating enzyme
MYKQVGDLKFTRDGIAKRGVLARHLVLPNDLTSSKKIAKFSGKLSINTYINVMPQYHPEFKADN